MRIFKIFSLLTLAFLLCVSCDKEAAGQIVFYSKDQLKKDLSIQINNTEGNTISVNSNAIVNLKSSKVFDDNIEYLKDIDVEALSFKIKNFRLNPSATISNIEVFVDEIKISENDISFDFLSILSNNLEFKVNNKEILSAISSKLLQKKQVVISYYSNAVSDKLFNFDLEFSLTTKGTFVD
ncbi:hypothetical protein [Polaribacter uvawellassae]|uniref:hypothetical protein n=1 Tax=Polaribacter uvawellassae TaxID=3133495 RepID=UPI00321BA5ED